MGSREIGHLTSSHHPNLLSILLSCLYLRYRKHAIVDGSGAAQPRLLHERYSLFSKSLGVWSPGLFLLFVCAVSLRSTATTFVEYFVDFSLGIECNPGLFKLVVRNYHEWRS